MKKHTAKMFLLLILSFTVSCNAQNLNQKKNTKNKSVISVCDIKNHLNKNLDIVLNSTRNVLRTKQERCLLELMDSLKANAISNGNIKYYIALDSLSKYSDGYVSEHFNSIIPELFYKNFNGLTGYLFANPKSTLKDFLIDGLSLEISMAENRDERKKQIEAFIDNNLKNGRLTETLKNFVQTIIQSLNPEKWD